MSVELFLVVVLIAGGRSTSPIPKVESPPPSSVPVGGATSDPRGGRLGGGEVTTLAAGTGSKKRPLTTAFCAGRAGDHDHDMAADAPAQVGPGAECCQGLAVKHLSRARVQHLDCFSSTDSRVPNRARKGSPREPCPSVRFTSMENCEVEVQPATSRSVAPGSAF